MVKTQTQSLNVLAAGSLRKALSPHLTQFSQQFGVNIHVQFGPAGLLREQIERGASWDLFASANLQHPQKLQEQGLAKSIMPFLRNRLCLTARRTCMNSESDSWLELLTNTQLRIGTSTPGCDPSGDYTWQLFDRVEALRPHAGESLKQRALKLVGGIDSLQVPPNEIASGWLIQQGWQMFSSVMRIMLSGYGIIRPLRWSIFLMLTMFLLLMHWHCVMKALGH